ncbi:MAG: hypothetical protein M5U08_15885 [Burkholderiales bacterium]|nr:hypothetical protein [Burkholderiales bacterium]
MRPGRGRHREQDVVSRIVREVDPRKPLDQERTLAHPVDAPADLRRLEVASDQCIAWRAPQLVAPRLGRNELESAIEPRANEFARFGVDANQRARRDVRVEDDPRERTRRLRFGRERTDLGGPHRSARTCRSASSIAYSIFPSGTFAFRAWTAATVCAKSSAPRAR